jgi:hypothetical protein
LIDRAGQELVISQLVLVQQLSQFRQQFAQAILLLIPREVLPEDLGEPYNPART